MSAAAPLDLLTNHQWMPPPTQGLEIQNPPLPADEAPSRHPDDPDFNTPNNRLSRLETVATNELPLMLSATACGASAISLEQYGTLQFRYLFAIH